MRDNGRLGIIDTTSFAGIFVYSLSTDYYVFGTDGASGALNKYFADGTTEPFE